MKYIGVDISVTSTGYCCIDDAGAVTRSGTIPSKSTNVCDLLRFDSIISRFMAAAEPKAEDKILFEQYAFSRRIGHITRFAELGGQLKREMMTTCGVDAKAIWTCSPTTLKKFATGKGVGSKDLILKAVYKKWGFDTDSDDEADAFVLANILRAALRYPARPPDFKYEVEAVKSLFKQNKVKVPRSR